MILGIDPGTTESGVCLLMGERVEQAVVTPNAELLRFLRSRNKGPVLAIEGIASYGMPVGAEVFGTCIWIGRFIEAWTHGGGEYRLVYRKDVKLHLCGSPRAKDTNIRQALIDKIGPVGTKKAPGPLYGVKSHAWAALAVAVTVADALPLKENP